MNFRNYGLQKTLLEKCLKSPVSEDPSTSNRVNVPKHYSMLNESTFSIFIDPCLDKSGWKSSLSDMQNLGTVF